MSDICTDNRFELIAKYKAKLIEATNIETSADEMAVIDNILFRMWQIGWLDRLEQPTVDAVQVVRCMDCKHRVVNEHYGEKGYIDLKAYCEFDTEDIFELGRHAADDDWFCADGERRTDEQQT